MKPLITLISVTWGEEPDIALYVLLDPIDRHQKSDLWAKTYEQAIRSGIRRRQQLETRYLEIQERSRASA
jgi:hypothetical protein